MYCMPIVFYKIKIYSEINSSSKPWSSERPPSAPPTLSQQTLVTPSWRSVRTRTQSENQVDQRRPNTTTTFEHFVNFDGIFYVERSTVGYPGAGNHPRPATLHHSAKDHLGQSLS